MTKSRRLQIMLTDADGLASLIEPAFLILDITKQDIKAGTIGSVLERLHVLTDTQESVVRYIVSRWYSKSVGTIPTGVSCPRLQRSGRSSRS